MNNTELTEKEFIKEFIAPYINLKHTFPWLSHLHNGQAEDTILGLSKEELSSLRELHTKLVKQAALELLKDDEITDLLEQLSFKGSETFLVLGDSNSLHPLSWFYILEEFLNIATERADFRFINSSVHQQTTSEALRMLDQHVLAFEPDWVFVELGRFDIQRLPFATDRTLLPLSETWENLNTIQEVLKSEISNPLIWITPTPAITELLDEFPMYTYDLDSKDMAQVIQLVAGKEGVIIDPTGNRMGNNQPDAWNYLTDGIHHSVVGHTKTARLIIERLAQKDSQATGA
ncbi:MAG: SGNH/GDSL hydrolase family protein [Bacteroidota bacterium]